MLMKTVAAINSLCFVEIKNRRKCRGGWVEGGVPGRRVRAPSIEMAGAAIPDSARCKGHLRTSRKLHKPNHA